MGTKSAKFQSENEELTERLAQIDQSGKSRRELAERIGVTMLDPQPGATVTSQVVVRGRCNQRPTTGRLQLIVSGVGNQSGFWPQSAVTFFNDSENTWEGRCHIGAPPGSQMKILVAYVGSDATLLLEYYAKVGDITNQWPAIDRLPSDVITLCELIVVRG